MNTQSNVFTICCAICTVVFFLVMERGCQYEQKQFESCMANGGTWMNNNCVRVTTSSKEATR